MWFCCEVGIVWKGMLGWIDIEGKSQGGRKEGRKEGRKGKITIIIVFIASVIMGRC